MPTQTVTFTPPTTMTADDAMAYIASKLPSAVIEHLNQTELDGTRTTTISQDGNQVTVTTTYTDSAASQYVNLMQNSTAKSDLLGEGWSMSFNPETADL